MLKRTRVEEVWIKDCVSDFLTKIVIIQRIYKMKQQQQQQQKKIIIKENKRARKIIIIIVIIKGEYTNHSSASS